MKPGETCSRRMSDSQADASPHYPANLGQAFANHQDRQDGRAVTPCTRELPCHNLAIPEQGSGVMARIKAVRMANVPRRFDRIVDRPSDRQGQAIDS